MDPKRLPSPFPASGTVLEPYPHLSCEELREEIASLQAKSSRGEALTFDEIEDLNRLKRTLQEREENGQC